MLGADRDHVATGARLASLRAALVAVEPSLVNFTISALGMIAANRSAHSSSISAGRVKFVPSSSDSRTASTTSG